MRFNGVINIYKEKGYTSHDVVAKLRGILNMKKIGHTGTLDPDAEGVLPVCIGNATKLCDDLMDKKKEYVAELILGKKTDTQDLSGNILMESDHWNTLTEADVKEAVSRFVGEYDQVPPMYSAIKVKGQKLYELARKGIEIERKPRRVRIDEIEILSIELPVIRIRVACGKGTYIRALCNDIGEALNTCGCMGSLVRTRSGQFYIDQSIRLSEVKETVLADRMEEILIPVDRILAGYPAVKINSQFEKLLNNGNPLHRSMLMEQAGSGAVTLERVRVYDSDDRFVAVYCYDPAKNLMMPEKMFLE